MKFLTLSQDGARLLLVLPDQLPLRSAAHSVRGCRPEGISKGQAAFSYPAESDIAKALLDAFEPRVDSEHAKAVGQLAARQAALIQAAQAKEDTPDWARLPASWGLRTTPMEHQAQALAFCASRFDLGATGSALLMEQGTGKSLVAVGLANSLYAASRIRWVLVLCPNSLKGEWAAEDGQVRLHSLASPAVRVLRGTRDRKQSQLRQILMEERPWGAGAAPAWVVTNYDEFAVKLRGRNSEASARRFRGTLDILRAAGPGLLICDESSELKNWKALRTQSVNQLAECFPYRLILTGTPVEAGPLDVWPQFEVLGKGMLGYNTALAFERAHAEYARVRFGRRTVVQVVGYRNLDNLEDRLSQCSFRARAEDCLDLPPVTVRKLPVELDASQGRLLRQLRDEQMATVDDLFLDGRNVLTRYQKMAQIGGGWAKAMDADGAPRGWVEVGNAKLKALEEYLVTALSDPQRKAVVFAEHPETELRAIAELCDAKGWGAVQFHGSMNDAERDEAKQAFIHGEPRVFVGQWQCAAKGLNLTVADTVVFYSMTWRYGTWAQARKRVHRKGQERHVTEVYLLGMCPQARTGRLMKTIDHVCVEALASKQDVADVVTGDKVARMMEAL